MSDRPPDSVAGPWEGPRREPPPTPGREPLFNAPPAAVLLALSMPLLFLVQLQLPDQGAGWALNAADLRQGRWVELLTAMVLHGGWTHVTMNAVFALAFATPAARLMRGLRGAVVLALFYMCCGVVAGLGFALVHWDGQESAWGASGAVFGLVGASIRLLRGRLASLFDR
jgi:membrane associated rhomboid family serine protease